MSGSEQHLQAIARSVWGATATVDGGAVGSSYLAVPDRARAHQLLPASPISVIAAAGRVSDDRGLARRARDAAGVAALLAADTLRPRRRFRVNAAETTIAGSLAAAARQPIHSVVVLCGPARANQKPVVQALDRFGRTVAYAKLAWNDLTTALLDHEHGALTTLSTAPLGPLVVPQVLGRGTTGGIEWLALSPVRRPRGKGPQLTAIDAAAAIEAIGTGPIVPLGELPFLERLASETTSLPLATTALERLRREHGDTPVRPGAWHGDFVPWNIASGRGGVAVWDWERFTTGVPAGLDRLHLKVQVDVHRRGVAIPAAVAALRTQADTLLPGVDAAGRRAIVAAYLTELLARYDHDRVGVARPTPLDVWCDALTDALDIDTISR